jgi:uncharacterized protein (DUF1501 family)
VREFRQVRRAVLAAIAVALALTFPLRAQSDGQTAVNAAFAKYQNLQEGKNADYIPALATVDPKLFGSCRLRSMTPATASAPRRPSATSPRR